MDLNFSHANCIKEANHLGKTIVHNICTGAEYTIQWGVFDWFLAIFAVLFIAGIIFALFAFIIDAFFWW